MRRPTVHHQNNAIHPTPGALSESWYLECSRQCVLAGVAHGFFASGLGSESGVQ